MHKPTQHRWIRTVTFGALTLALFFALLLLLIAARPAHAQTLITLYTFGSGANPYGGLVLDGEGNLYGTAQDGGNGDCYLYARGCGIVFEVTPSGAESVLHQFGSGVNAFPMSGLIFDSEGNLYGTTHGQGEDRDYDGSVFELKKKSGAEKVLYKFRGSRIKQGDGAFPEAGLVRDSKGNLFGTTPEGGANGLGTVFEVTATGTETVFYSFGSHSNDGFSPYAGLVMDGQGNLYGTTYTGGAYNQGTVFEVAAAGTEKVLYSFGSQSSDGANPLAGLIMDAQGNLYGTTTQGGAYGEGTVFEVAAAGTEKVLYSFGSKSGDGFYPNAGLVMDAQGNLYGTTLYGGSPSASCSNNRCGTVFELASGTETVLYSFCSDANCTDGERPTAGVVLDSQGNLYGTTEGGGTLGCNFGCGTVFKLTL